MELLLLERELWDIIVQEVPSAPDAKWLIRDGKARATIGLAVEESQKVHIKKLKTAKEFWNVLKKHHEKSNLTNKVSLLRQLSTKRMQGGQAMEEHITEFMDIVDRLNDLGEEIGEHKTVAFLLGSLPEEYNSLVSSLEMRPENDLTVDLVKEKLLQEFTRKSEVAPMADTVFKTQKKFKPKCFSCDCRRHKGSDLIEVERTSENMVNVPSEVSNSDMKNEGISSGEEEDEFCGFESADEINSTSSSDESQREEVLENVTSNHNAESRNESKQKCTA
ncbi:uncharacterized protein LOC133331495 [Musca vetustissima]|uniref:uncharacterized protein LOC133331495 n=1 Tax=Musca vetustissima TaxID=27455 RepID=UPI002AB72261|nr:uncharacterized protein LOC133331495 [Musca vetustissima]